MPPPAAPPSTVALNLFASYIAPFFRGACQDVAEAHQAALATIESLDCQNFPQLLAATRTIAFSLAKLESLAATVGEPPDSMNHRILAATIR